MSNRAAPDSAVCRRAKRAPPPVRSFAVFFVSSTCRRIRKGFAALISAVHLGLIDYANALALQRRLVDARKQGTTGDVLLFLEHSPVITLGRNARREHVLVSAQELQDQRVGIFECDRGGDVTFHGPGQLVGYPIFDLRGFACAPTKRKSLGAVEFVRRLEEVLIRTCAAFKVLSQRVPGLTGVWTRETESKPPAKIAAIGVHVSQSVTSHGFALNVNTNLDYFRWIVPCGISCKPVTSMENELGAKVDLQGVMGAAARSFAEVFQTEIELVESLEQLSHKLGLPLRPPAELRRLYEEETYWA
ncbi:MAG: lipoyl(octanoyl) transferase LipB [Acidobacteria bacterium]|nr:lipoyl(octanoyl) transferase LipB [Acidobacteriota bacterium]